MARRCGRRALLHRLREMITVVSGVLVGESKAPFQTQKLVEMMFGREVWLGAREATNPGGCVIEMRGVAVEDVRLHISGVDLKVHAGEVIGLAGMEGSGQGPFIRACAGLIRPVAGSIFVHGQNLTGKSYHVFKQHGVSFIDRKSTRLNSSHQLIS